MANPAIVTCSGDAWTLVAENVTGGTIYNMTPDVEYMQTYRMTGEAAPAVDTDAVPAFIYKNDPLGISASVAIDVYLKAVGEAGAVRVDL